MVNLDPALKRSFTKSIIQRTVYRHHGWFCDILGKTIMHDPMAMRPFMGYNFGHYLQHWLDLSKPGRKVRQLDMHTYYNNGPVVSHILCG